MPSETRRGAVGALGLATAWALLVVGVPVAFATQGHDTPRSGYRTVVATATYLAGSVICHQQPTRSFYLRGTQLPVCARCAGLYLAAPFGAAWVLGTRARSRRRTSGFAVAGAPERWRGVQIALAVAALPTGVTWGAEFFGLLSPSNMVRAVAAIPLGFSVAAAVGLAVWVPKRAGVIQPTQR
jgi:uncharacterized membrane protein YeiB